MSDAAIIKDIGSSIYRATTTKCGCGLRGDWSKSVWGTSGLVPVVWAGCGNCRGSAVGAPVSRKDFSKWEEAEANTKASAIAEAFVLDKADFISDVYEVNWVLSTPKRQGTFEIKVNMTYRRGRPSESTMTRTVTVQVLMNTLDSTCGVEFA